MIPAIVSQTWKTKSLSGDFARYHRSWKDKNPDFEIRLYDDDEAARLVGEIFPEHLDLYRNFPNPVMRADFFRYAVIYRDGGFYADIDVECLKPVEGLRDIAGALLSLQACLSPQRQRELAYPYGYQISNFIFAAVPRHPLFKAAVGRIATLADRLDINDPGQIEDITGPRMLTRLFYEMRPHDVAVTHQIYLAPPLHFRFIPGFWQRAMTCHHYSGTWTAELIRGGIKRRWIERDRMVNPFPQTMLRLEPEGNFDQAFGKPHQ